MTRYYFHATDGYAAVFDTCGLHVEPGDLAETAALAASALRRHFGALADLSDWLVLVYDDRGEEIEAFPLRELPEIVEQDLVAA